MKNMYRNVGILLIILLLLLLLFGPSSCNGITYYNGIRGCSSGGKTGWDGSKSDSRDDDDGHGSAFLGLINW